MRLFGIEIQKAERTQPTRLEVLERYCKVGKHSLICSMPRLSEEDIDLFIENGWQLVCFNSNTRSFVFQRMRPLDQPPQPNYPQQEEEPLPDTKTSIDQLANLAEKLKELQEQNKATEPAPQQLGMAKCKGCGTEFAQTHRMQFYCTSCRASRAKPPK